jgi:DNA-binding XRE family transcriptional regulator
MVYFIKQNDYIKIGYTNNFNKRLNQLQVSSPVKLEVLGIIKGTKDDESNYHKMFSKYHSNGEWFNCNEELISYIDKLDIELMWKYGFIQNETTPIGLIKYCRIEKNLSLDELGELLGMSKQAVLDAEKRELQGRITIKNLYKLLNVMGYKLEFRCIKIIN